MFWFWLERGRFFVDKNNAEWDMQIIAHIDNVHKLLWFSTGYVDVGAILGIPANRNAIVFF